LIKVNIFFNEYINRKLLKSIDIKYIVNQILDDHKINEGTVSIIFVDDRYITELNKKYFNKENPTDVMSFNLEEKGEALEGEVYISIETAEWQAQDYKVSIDEEVIRLIIHGSLHLLGYGDSDKEKKQNMTRKEDYYIKLYKENET